MYQDKVRLVLASASPRRRRLLAASGVRFYVDPSNIDETVGNGEAPHAYVERSALEKAFEVVARHADEPLLAADTTVVLHGKIIGKPDGPEGAKKMLAGLAGRTHTVITGMALMPNGVAGPVLYRAVETKVKFRNFSGWEIEHYVAGGDPLDKAGSYGIQGSGGGLVECIEGSYTNVIGLPLAEAHDMLWRELGESVYLEKGEESE